MIMRLIACIICLFLSVGTGYAAPYVIDAQQSTLHFAGEQSGKAFEGTFHAWGGDIIFDPHDLEGSSIKLSIDTASAKTGDKMIDGTLAQKDWFNSQTYPSARFNSTKIEFLDKNYFRVTGSLTLRNKVRLITFYATIDGLEGDRARAHGSLSLDRLFYEIGRETDPKAQWVSQDIVVSFDLHAVKSESAAP